MLTSSCPRGRVGSGAKPWKTREDTGQPETSSHSWWSGPYQTTVTTTGTSAARTKAVGTSGTVPYMGASSQLCVLSQEPPPPSFCLIRASYREDVPLGLAWAGLRRSEEVTGEPQTWKGWGGQTSHRYLNWVGFRELHHGPFAHLRLFHLSNSSDCFTLRSRGQRVHERGQAGHSVTIPEHAPLPVPLKCQVLG